MTPQNPNVRPHDPYSPGGGKILAGPPPILPTGPTGPGPGPTGATGATGP